MKIKTAKQIGFFTAICMLAGTVVGSGIFFKNKTVFNFNDFSSIGIIISWIVASLLTLTIGYSFSEINRTKNSKLSGFLNWGHSYGSKHFRTINKFSFPTFMFMFNVMIVGYVFSLFATKLISVSGAFDPDKVPVIVHVCAGLGIVIILKSLQYFLPNSTGITQTITTIIKFLPLILIAFIGLALWGTHKGHPVAGSGRDFFGINLFSANKPIQFSGVVLAIPAILFAYDGFLNIGQITKHMKGGEKSAPRVTIIGLSIVVVTYLVVTIAQIVHGAPSVSAVLEDAFSPQVADAFKVVVLATIVVSVYGGLNGYIFAASAAFEQIIKINGIYGSRWLMQKTGRNEHKSALLMFYFWLSIYALIGIISSLITFNNPNFSFMDSWSNSISLYSYITYLFIIVFYWKARHKTAHNKNNAVLWYLFSGTSVILGTFFLGYQVFYVVSIEPLIQGHWDVIKAVSIPFYLSLAWTLGLPYLNQFCLNREMKKYPDAKIDWKLETGV